MHGTPDTTKSGRDHCADWAALRPKDPATDAIDLVIDKTHCVNGSRPEKGAASGAVMHRGTAITVMDPSTHFTPERPN